MAEDQKPSDDVNRTVDVVDAWDRAQHLMIPRWAFPFVAAIFVVLCATMAVILFGVGKIFGGLLFSAVVIVGFYVAYNNLRDRASRARLSE